MWATAGFIKKVHSVCTFLINTIYLSHYTQVAEGTTWKKNMEPKIRQSYTFTHILVLKTHIWGIPCFLSIVSKTHPNSFKYIFLKEIVSSIHFFEPAIISATKF